MQKQRLLKLADALEANAKNKKGVKFDLNGWGNKSYNNALADPPKIESKNDLPLNCGTTACAVGYAAVSGMFRRSGFTFEILRNGTHIQPIYLKYEGWGAVTVFFDLTSNEAEFLFSPDCYDYEYHTEAKGERYVAKRIRNFVKAGGIPQKDRMALGL